MGLKKIQGRKRKGALHNVYTLGSETIGEFRLSDAVIFKRIDPKTGNEYGRVIARGFLAEYEIDTFLEQYLLDSGLGKLAGNKRIAEIGYGLKGVPDGGGSVKIEKINNDRVRKFYQDWLQKGFGTKMIQALEEIARKKRVGLLLASINPENFASVKTAEKCGFKRFKESGYWYKKLLV